MKKRNLSSAAILILISISFLLMGAVASNVTANPAEGDIFINSLSGLVEVSRAKDPGGWLPAKSGSKLSLNDHIRTGNKSYTVLSLADAGTIATKDETEIVLVSTTGKPRQIKLLRGKMMADVKNISSEFPIEIEMNRAKVKITGAAFILESSAESSTAKVIEGTLSFNSIGNGQEIQVNSGQMVWVDEQGLGGPQKADLMMDKLELAHYKTIASKNPVSPVQRNIDQPVEVKSWNLNIYEKWWYLIPLLIFILIAIILLRGKRKKKGDQVQVSTPKVSASPERKLCRQCGSSLPDGVKFCTNCGKTIGEDHSTPPPPQINAILVCTGCGAEVHPGEKFCTKCGTPLSMSPPAVPVQQVAVNSEKAYETVDPPRNTNKPPGKKGKTFLKIVLTVLLITCLAVAGLYFFGTYHPDSMAKRASLFEDEKYDPAKIESAAPLVETIFASSDTASLAKILSPTTLEQRRRYFPELVAHMPTFARDFKTRKLLYATARLAVYEFSSSNGKFTAEFCLGNGGKWLLMRF